MSPLGIVIVSHIIGKEKKEEAEQDLLSLKENMPAAQLKPKRWITLTIFKVLHRILIQDNVLVLTVTLLWHLKKTPRQAISLFSIWRLVL